MLTSTTSGAIRKMRLSARSGEMSSFCSHLPTSANSCMLPYGPASIGPRRLCMKLIILNRNRYTMVPAGSSTATVPPSTRSSDCAQYGKINSEDHRSMSPRMKYSEARMEMTSGTYTPRSTHGTIEMLLKLAERIFTRNGPRSPLLTT